MEFDDLTSRNYVFYLEIFNSGKKSFIVKPEKIYMEILTSKTKEEGYHNKSVNPEIVLKSINEKMDNREDWHGVFTGLNLLGTVFSIVADLSMDRNYKTENVVEDISIGVNNQINEEIDYDNDIEEMNSEKQFWKTEVLRKTTLYPNEGIGGLVFFQCFKAAKIVKVHIPIGGTVHTYLFEQVRIN